MWPFLLPLAALVAAAVFWRSDAGRSHRKGLLWMLITAALLSVLGILLMGIPGAVVYELSVPWVRAMQGARFTDLGDGAWPAAILISLTWPASLVIAYTVANGPLRRRGRMVRWIAIIGIAYGSGVALAFWAHASAAP